MIGLRFVGFRGDFVLRINSNFAHMLIFCAIKLFTIRPQTIPAINFFIVVRRFADSFASFSKVLILDESADEEAVSTHVSTSISGGAGGGLNPNSAGSTSVGMGGNHHHQTLHSSADVNSLKSSSSYSSLTEFVCDMRSADINGDCIPPTPSSNGEYS